MKMQNIKIRTKIISAFLIIFLVLVIFDLAGLNLLIYILGPILAVGLGVILSS